MLLIYGDRDKHTPPAHGQRMLRALRDAAAPELCVIPGVEHTFAYRDAADTYVAQVIPFRIRAADSQTLTVRVGFDEKSEG